MKLFARFICGIASLAVCCARADDLYVICENNSTVIKLSESMVPILRGDNTTAKVPATLITTIATNRQIFYGFRTDRLGDLYMPDPAGNRILKFSCVRGTISDAPQVFAVGLNAPLDLAFDPDNNMYEIESNGNINKFEFVGGKVSNRPTRFADASPDHANLTGARQPLNLAFDAKGNLYVAILVGGILKFSHSSAGLSNLPDDDPFSNISRARELAFDRDGNLFVANHLGDEAGIYEFRNSSTGLSGTPTTFAKGDGLDAPTGVAFDSQGNLYVTNWGGGSGTTILEYRRTAGILSKKPVVFGSDFGTPVFILAVKTAGK